MRNYNLSRLLVTTSMIAALTTVSHAAVSSKNQTTDNHNNNKSSMRTFSLVDGYNHDTGNYTDLRCLAFNPKTDVEVNNQSEAVVRIDGSTDYKTILSEFDFFAEGQYKGGFFNASALLDYVSSIKETSTSLSLTYYGKLVGKQEVFKPASGNYALHGPGQTHAGNSENFRVFCGNEFITSLTKGAMLLFNVNLDFHSVESKEKYKSEFGASTSFGNITAKIKTLNMQNNESIKLQVSAYQLGGNAGELFGIISGAGLTQCLFIPGSGDKLSGCEKLINNLTEYTKSFSRQLSEEKYVTTNYKTLSYTAALGYRDNHGNEYAGKTLLTDGINKARNYLSEVHHDLAKDLLWLNTTTKDYTDHGDFMKNRKNNLTNLQQKTNYLLKNCYGSEYRNCASLVEQEDLTWDKLIRERWEILAFAEDNRLFADIIYSDKNKRGSQFGSLVSTEFKYFPVPLPSAVVIFDEQDFSITVPASVRGTPYRGVHLEGNYDLSSSHSGTVDINNGLYLYLEHIAYGDIHPIIFGKINIYN